MAKSLPPLQQPPGHGLPYASDGDDGRTGVRGRIKRGQKTLTGSHSQIILDPVTGLPARFHLHDWVVEAIERSRPASSRAVVAFVDIGLLRDVNDTYGADLGDKLLRAVGERLSSIDLPNTRVLRNEGAVFAAIFQNVSHLEAAEEIAQFLNELLTPAFDIGLDRLSINPSVGAALSTDNYNSVDDFIHDAHEALVRAREGGPGAWVVHDESKRGRYATRIDEARLKSAIENEEFLLVYQPIVRLDTNQLIGVEALIRWQQPAATNSGMLLPHDFMPMLEKTGLGIQVGQWVIEEACRQTALWNQQFPNRPALFVTVNVGARQLAAADFRDQVVQALNASRVQPWQLCIDITEAALRFNRSGAWAALRDLKDMGIKLGLDDFGTGVSSMIYLREFTLDLIRVDRVFVAGMEMSKEDRAIIKHIAGLAHDLGLVAIAEGVENSDQASALKKLGIDLAQGFYFGRPERAEVIAKKIDPTVKSGSTWDSSQVIKGTP